MAKNSLKECFLRLAKIKRSNDITEDLVKAFHVSLRSLADENIEGFKKIVSSLESGWSKESRKELFVKRLIKIDLQPEDMVDQDRENIITISLLGRKLQQEVDLSSLSTTEDPTGLKLVNLSIIYDQYIRIVNNLGLEEQNVIEDLFKNVIVSLIQEDKVEEIADIFLQIKEPLQDILTIISNDNGVSRDEVKAIHKLYKSGSPVLFKNIASVLCDAMVNSSNQELFFNFMVEIDIEYQSFVRHRNIEESFFLHLLKCKLFSSDRIEHLCDLLSSDEDQGGNISVLLQDLLEEVKSFSIGLEKLGVEVLGRLDFVYEVFKHSILLLIYEHNSSDEQNQKLTNAMDSFLQSTQAEYKLDDVINYRSLLFAESKNITLECKVTEETVNVLKLIDVSECDEVQVKVDTGTIDVERNLGLLMKFAEVATSLECLNITTGSGYIIETALKNSKLVKLSLIGMHWGDIHMERFTPLILDSPLLSALHIEGTRLNDSIHLIFKGMSESNLVDISLVDCQFDARMIMMAIDILNRNPVLKTLRMDGCELVTAHASALVSSTFSDITETMYDKIKSLGMPEGSLIDSFVSTYAMGDMSRIPPYQGEFSDNLFFHMLHSMFNTKYNIDAPSESLGSLQVWLKDRFLELKQFMPFASLPELTEDEKTTLESFKKFIPKDEPLKTKYAYGEEGVIAVAQYYHPILVKAHEFSEVNEFPILNDVVRWMLEDIYFQRGVRVPTESTITALSIAGNKMYDFAASISAIILVCYPYLKELDISDSGFGDDGSLALVSALGQNKSLTKLFIRNNDITDVGGRAFEIVLQEENTTLITLDISENEISDLIMEGIRVALDRNSQQLGNAAGVSSSSSSCGSLLLVAEQSGSVGASAGLQELDSVQDGVVVVGEAGIHDES